MTYAWYCDRPQDRGRYAQDFKAIDVASGKRIFFKSRPKDDIVFISFTRSKGELLVKAKLVSCERPFYINIDPEDQLVAEIMYQNWKKERLKK